MRTHIPITIEGNLTGPPVSGATEAGKAWTRLRVAVNDRRLNPNTNTWEDGAVVYHDVVTFGAQAAHVKASLDEGDPVLVHGNLRFDLYDNPTTGKISEVRQIVADTVAVSLRHREVSIQRPHTAEATPEAVPQHAAGPAPSVTAAL